MALTGLINVLEPQHNLSGSLPQPPVLEEGIHILEADVVELSKSNTIQQVLCKDVVAWGLLQLRPQDSSLPT